MTLSTVTRGAFRPTWWALVIRGLISIGVGVVLLARPLQSVAVVALLIAIWALASGLVEIVHAVQLRPVFRQWRTLLMSGVISIAFGIAAPYYYPLLSLGLIVLWMGTWLVIVGGVHLFVAIHHRQLGLPWSPLMVLGVMSLVASALTFVYPITSLAILLVFLATFALTAGEFLVFAAYLLATGTPLPDRRHT